MTEYTCRKCGANLGTPTNDSDQQGAAFTLRNGDYGCDSGCMIVVADINCKCGDDWEGWEFGEMWPADDQKEAQRYADTLYQQYRDDRG